jgi:hypothetical protein
MIVLGTVGVKASVTDGRRCSDDRRCGDDHDVEERHHETHDLIFSYPKSKD